jgi:hypothetical protein
MMPIVSTWLNIKPKVIQLSSRPDNKKMNYDYEQNAKIEVSKTISSQNKQPLKKIEHENKQQVDKDHFSKKHDNKNYNNSSSIKIRYNKKAEDNPILTPASSSNLTLTDTDASNACKKVLRTKEIFWNEWNEPDCFDYVESSSPYYSPQCQSAGQMESTRYSSNYSSTSTQSSCVDGVDDQELYNVHDNRNKRGSTTEESAKREISQYWVTSLYDIYLVTQKFNPSENMHQNYLGSRNFRKKNDIYIY